VLAEDREDAVRKILDFFVSGNVLFLLVINDMHKLCLLSVLFIKFGVQLLM
jgi:hypothetical protein